MSNKECPMSKGAPLFYSFGWIFLSCFTPLTRLNLLQGSRCFRGNQNKAAIAARLSHQPQFSFSLKPASPKGCQQTSN
jgi:hypothetical protein